MNAVPMPLFCIFSHCICFFPFPLINFSFHFFLKGKKQRNKERKKEKRSDEVCLGCIRCNSAKSCATWLSLSCILYWTWPWLIRCQVQYDLVLAKSTQTDLLCLSIHWWIIYILFYWYFLSLRLLDRIIWIYHNIAYLSYPNVKIVMLRYLTLCLQLIFWFVLCFVFCVPKVSPSTESLICQTSIYFFFPFFWVNVSYYGVPQ